MARVSSPVDVDVLSVAQAVAYLGVSGRMIRTLLKTGELKGRIVGRAWKIHRDAIREYLMEGPRQAA